MILMKSLEFEVYSILKNKFGEKESLILMEYFEAKTERNYPQRKDVLATKEDISKLEIGILQLENRLIKRMYWISIVQFFATVGALITIIKFMMH